MTRITKTITNIDNTTIVPVLTCPGPTEEGAGGSPTAPSGGILNPVGAGGFITDPAGGTDGSGGGCLKHGTSPW